MVFGQRGWVVLGQGGWVVGGQGGSRPSNETRREAYRPRWKGRLFKRQRVSGKAFVASEGAVDFLAGGKTEGDF